MNLFSLLNRRVRGFRILELIGAGFLTALVLTVYLAKTGAGDKRDDIDRVQQQIEEETAQIRLLRAEVAAEERPERLEALAGQYLGLQPVSAKHEIEPEALADVAQLSRPAEAKPATAAVAAATPQVPPERAPVAKATHVSIGAASTASVSTLQAAAYVVRQSGAPVGAASSRAVAAHAAGQGEH
ncbi:MAG TPA: cell division protein [Caulobacteraceae bacterium]|jgi:cell division protein FtsL